MLELVAGLKFVLAAGLKLELSAEPVKLFLAFIFLIIFVIYIFFILILPKLHLLQIILNQPVSVIGYFHFELFQFAVYLVYPNDILLPLKSYLLLILELRILLCEDFTDELSVVTLVAPLTFVYIFHPLSPLR